MSSEERSEPDNRIQNLRDPNTLLSIAQDRTRFLELLLSYMVIISLLQFETNADLCRYLHAKRGELPEKSLIEIHVAK